VKTVTIGWRSRKLRALYLETLQGSAKPERRAFAKISAARRRGQYNSSQNSLPAVPLKSGSGGMLFWKEQFETVCFNSFILKPALKWAWSACLRAF
jgi:hypothetical protein